MRKKRGRGKSKKQNLIRKKIQYGLFVFFTLIILLNLYLLTFTFSLSTPTGQASTTSGQAILTIVHDDREITIYHPENITYNYTALTNPWGPFMIDLEVSANFPVELGSWKYTIEDPRRGWFTDSSGVALAGNPNWSIEATRWDNILTAYATDYTDGRELNASVTFYIHYDNTAPLISSIDDPLYVCEDTSLNYHFTATDYDEDFLSAVLIPTDPFFVINPPVRLSPILNEFILSSFLLNKTYVGGVDNGFLTYPETINVFDTQHVASRLFDIIVIEINNAPHLTTPGVQTIWDHGDNTNFYYELFVYDVEDGYITSSGINLTYSIVNSSGDTYNLFNMTSGGIMNYTANTSSVLDVYTIRVCAEDTGIANPHPEIVNECGQDGTSTTTCQQFSLTVTDENRPPIITDHYPRDLNFSAAGDAFLIFNVTEYDPDHTIPDAYWYIDGNFAEYDTNSSIDDFNHTFGCGVSGEHFIRVDVTDGELNDSLEWNISVANVPCPVPPGGSSSSGAGSPQRPCQPMLGCRDWNTCQNLQKSLEEGLVSGEDYRYINLLCEEIGLSELECGYQLRICYDFNNCTTNEEGLIEQEEEIQHCFYTHNPTCDDGIKNCHDGSCELLIDCGGPCGPCPTCDDGIKNQGEEGEDCGGPCPYRCEDVKPFKISDYYMYIFLSILLLLIIIVIIIIVRIIRMRKKLRVSPV